ncbi:MAG: hypothetical protein GX548_08695 [Lentisphaerae bacterium]|nr:hypothetical protein [Lentisphaerota bacterium]
MRKYIPRWAWCALPLALALGQAVTRAGPGDGVRIRSWVLNPYFELTLTDTSNVYKDRFDPIRDTFIEPELGIRFSSSSETNCFNIVGSLFYSERKYAHEKTRDFSTYGDSLTFRGGHGRRASVELIQSYRHLDDNDRHASDFETSELAGDMVQDSNTLDLERDIHQIGGTLARRFTDKLEAGVSYRYSGVLYENLTHDRLDPKQLGVPYGLDLHGHIWQVDGGLALTDKTDATLTFRHGRQYQEDTDGSARMETLRLGLKTKNASKTIYHAGIGVEQYRRPPHIDDKARLSFNYNFAVDWFLTEKITFRSGGFNGTQFSSFYQSNALEYYSIWAGLGYRWRPSTTFSVRGVYRFDDYLDPVTHEGVTRDRKDTRLTGHLRADYLATRGSVRLFAEATYDEVISNFDFVEYEDIRIVLGIHLRY